MTYVRLIWLVVGEFAFISCFVTLLVCAFCLNIMENGKQYKG